MTAKRMRSTVRLSEAAAEEVELMQLGEKPFDVTVATSHHAPYYNEGDVLTIDPDGEVRAGDDVLALDSTGRFQVRRALTSATDGPVQMAPIGFRGPIFVHEERGEGHSPAFSVACFGLIIRRRRLATPDICSTSQTGMAWKLPRKVHPDAPPNSLPVYRPEVPSDEDLFLFGSSSVNTALARAAELETERGGDPIIAIMTGLEESPMAARLFQEFVRREGPPQDFHFLEMLVARAYLAGTLAQPRAASYDPFSDSKPL